MGHDKNEDHHHAMPRQRSLANDGGGNLVRQNEVRIANGDDWRSRSMELPGRDDAAPHHSSTSPHIGRNSHSPLHAAGEGDGNQAYSAGHAHQAADGARVEGRKGGRRASRSVGSVQVHPDGSSPGRSWDASTASTTAAVGHSHSAHGPHQGDGKVLPNDGNVVSVP
jgi:hypothetical protein